ncbi:MAG: hypothetical protein K2V38_10840, partial [Gemmataceae bacterium]|nr:hypothetical protein [Gemmataceae bacterium]
MQVTPADPRLLTPTPQPAPGSGTGGAGGASTPTTSSAGPTVSVRVLAGQLAAVPVGELLQAVVTRVDPNAGTADIRVNGQSLTVTAPPGLDAGAALLVRVPKGANGELQISDAPAAPKPAPPNSPAQPGEVQLVDVTATLPDGRVRVQIDGREVLATPTEPLATNGQLVLQVFRGPNGLTLSPPAPNEALPAAVAGAVLRSASATEFAPVLRPLQAELAALIQAKPSATEVQLPTQLRDAAVVLRDTVRAFLPEKGEAPTAAQLQNLIDNGGLHFEAKLARLAVGSPDVNPSRPEVAGALRGDLKGDLLRLLQSAQDLGVASQLPASRAALGAVESHQATQVLAQSTQTPYLLQLPFPDGED